MLFVLQSQHNWRKTNAGKMLLITTVIVVVAIIVAAVVMPPQCITTFLKISGVKYHGVCRDSKAGGRLVEKERLVYIQYTMISANH